MRRITASTFVSLDGVMQAPGGPTEDPSGGFPFGGWLPPFFDDVVGQFVGEAMGQDYDLLLGRKTYEIFAAHWGHSGDEMGALFTTIAKYVAAGADTPMNWNNSHRLEGDVAQAVAKLKAGGDRSLLIQGSSTLIQTLLKADLIDEISTLTFPLVLGQGKRLFEPSGHARVWTLVETRHSPSGVVASRYQRAGMVTTGSFQMSDPNKEEAARQARMRREG
ncbi:dihydrofolate reductase family protein [Brevundimonas sp. DC300-4]|uniref:dihydrofolate reductase family protein n=1 Tax=Brevundimonas sp. DC300-4 TaxID=2804594 RepID=UPI003CF4C33E